MRLSSTGRRVTTPLRLVPGRVTPRVAAGVYPAPYLIDGVPALLAIDSHGNCVKRVRLEDEALREVATDWLLGLIAHADDQRARGGAKTLRPGLRVLR